MALLWPRCFFFPFFFALFFFPSAFWFNTDNLFMKVFSNKKLCDFVGLKRFLKKKKEWNLPTAYDYVLCVVPPPFFFSSSLQYLEAHVGIFSEGSCFDYAGLSIYINVDIDIYLWLCIYACVCVWVWVRLCDCMNVHSEPVTDFTLLVFFFFSKALLVSTYLLLTLIATLMDLNSLLLWSLSCERYQNLWRTATSVVALDCRTWGDFG